MNLILLTRSNNIILKPFTSILGLILEGIFWFLGLFMEYPNVGVAIILLTIIIYVLMIPLTVKQQKYSKLSSKMNPEITAIQAKYKGKTDQESMQRMQQETQMVYTKYGVSASGSCLQLLIQLPILYALYRVIYNMPAYVSRIREVFYPLVSKLSDKVLTETFTELINKFASYGYYAKQVTNESFGTVAEYTENTLIDLLYRASTGNWSELAATYPDLAEHITNAAGTGTVDKLMKFNYFLGMNISDSPSYVIKEQMAGNPNFLLIFAVIMIPVLSAVTQWINTKLMPQPAETGKKGTSENSMMQSMKTMNTLMPLMSAFFCFSFPIGMGLYWITGSVVRCVIQVVVNKQMDKLDVDEMIKQNIEKANEKRRKQGLPPHKISSNATINTRNVDSRPIATNSNVKAASSSASDHNASNNSSDNADASAKTGGLLGLGKKAEVPKNVKDSTEYYNKNSDKPGSLASKAAMVKHYNEKNTKKD